MANGDININVGANVAPANTALTELQNKINGTTTDLMNAQQTMGRAITRMTKDIAEAMDKAKAGSSDLLRLMRQFETVRSATISNQSKGNSFSHERSASATQLINEARNEAENVTARITNALVGQYTQRLKAMDRVVEARIRQADESIDQLVARYAPDVASGRVNISNRTNQRTSRRGNNSRYLDAVDSRTTRNDNQLEDDENNVPLIGARLTRRQRRNARDIRRASNPDYQQSLDINELAAEQRAIERATRPVNTALVQAQESRNQRTHLKIIADEADVLGIRAKEILAEQANQNRIIRADNLLSPQGKEAALAKQAANARLQLANIDREKDTLLQEANVILARQARDKRVERAFTPADTELDAVKETRRIRLRREFIDRETNYVANETARLAKLESNKKADIDPALLAAQQSRLARRKEQLIRAENNLVDLRNKEILREQAEAQRQDSVNRLQNAPLQRARDNRRARNDANLLRDDQIGPAAAGMERRREALAVNGGADLIAVQARVLAGGVALYGVLNSIRETAQFVVQLDGQFRQFQAITATTNTEMVGLKASLIEVSQASKFTAVEIAQAATVMGQAGFSAREVAESIGSISQLATAAGSSLAESVDVVTSTMSIFNLQTSQAADIANTMTAALNLSKLSMDKLTLGFQYAGNIAAQMGITYQELTGVLGALANSGIQSGSTLGTGLRQLLIDIQNPTEKFTATLKELGLTQQDVNVESNGLLPVLNLLKDSGFGAAQAFESFEVRAAAAFAALSNNTDLAAELQEQFILSSAATEANAIQMESLSNTYAKFQSVVGTVAYNAFEPMLEVLQNVIEAVANFLGTLNKAPGILQFVGAAITALGTALTVSLSVAVFRGLIMAIPIFTAFGAGAAAATAPTAALGVASGVAAGQVGLLNIAMKANWIVAAISLIAGLAVAFQAFGESAQTAADRVDILKAQVSNFKGEADSANGQIEAIEQTITNLIRQKEALDNDPLMNRAKILEVKQAFREISEEVNTTTGSVDDLIEALRNLQAADFTKLSASLEATVAANDALIVGYQNQLAEQSPQASGNVVYDAVTGLRSISDEGNDLYGSMMMGHGLDANNQITQEFKDRLSEVYGKVFNEAATTALGYALNPETIPEDISNARASLSRVSTESSRLTQRQRELSNKQALGTLSSGEEQELNRIQPMLDILESVSKNLETLVNIRGNIATTESANRIISSDLQRSRVNENLEYQAIGNDKNTLAGDIRARQNKILRNPNSDPEASLAAIKRVEDEFQERLAKLVTRADELRAKMVEQGLGTDEELKDAMAPVINALASQGAQISTSVGNANVLYQSTREDAFRGDLAEIDDKINLQVDQLRRANTREEIDTISNYVMRLFDEKRQIIAQIFQSELEQANKDPEKEADATRASRESRSELNRQEQDFNSTLAEDRTALQIKMVEEEKVAIDRDIATMDRKIDDLLKAIAAADPGAAMDGLTAQWLAVVAAQQGLVTRSNELGISGAMLEQGTPLVGGQVTSANRMMRILMEEGLTPERAAGMVGNAAGESKFDPMAAGDKDANGVAQAHGLWQLHPDRQLHLREYMAEKKLPESSFNDADTQTRFAVWEMKKYEPAAWADLNRQNTSSGAADSVRLNYERPRAANMFRVNAGVATPEDTAALESAAYRRQVAQGLMGVDYNSQAQDLSEQGTDQRAATATSFDRASRRTRNSRINSLNEQVDTQMTTAGGLTQNSNIQPIIEKVQGLYDEIMAEELRNFDRQNADSLNSADTQEQRGNLIDQIKEEQTQKVLDLTQRAQRNVNAAIDANTRGTTQQIQTLMTQAGITENPDTIKSIIGQVNALYDEAITEKTRNFDQQNAEALAAGNLDVTAERADMVEGLRSDQNQKTSQLLDQYWTALDERINDPIEDAQAALDNAQRPENASRFTGQDILNLQNNVALAEREAVTRRLVAAEQVLLEVRAQLAATEPNTPEHNAWLIEEANALDRVNELQRENTAAVTASTQATTSMSAAIESANIQWQIQNGIRSAAGDLIPLADQVEKAWGGVLDMLSTGFSTLFYDLARGTMTAEEAFKKFALSVIEQLMQMIAKALVMNMLTSMMSGEGTSGELGGGGEGQLDFGKILGSLLGSAIPAAANGEVVPGTSNRDSVLRKVMPGEVILRRSAVSAIGEGALEKINNLGSRSISDNPMPANDNMDMGGGGLVNVWVVSPDQVPQMGPNDIIATVGDNISRKGSLKQLIKQVQMGAI